MHPDECYYLGYFQKTIGTKGELALKLDVDSPSDYRTIDRLFVQINEADKSLVPFFVSKSALNQNFILRCQLETVDAIGDAKALVGKSVFMPLSFLKPLKDGQFYFHEVIDFQVIDKEFGQLGPVKEVISYSHSNLFLINKDDKEILIPINKQIIERVDKKEEKIYVNCPDGLIALYLEN